jgi:hypothetical protein
LDFALNFSRHGPVEKLVPDSLHKKGPELGFLYTPRYTEEAQVKERDKRGRNYPECNFKRPANVSECNGFGHVFLDQKLDQKLEPGSRILQERINVMDAGTLEKRYRKDIRERGITLRTSKKHAGRLSTEVRAELEKLPLYREQFLFGLIRHVQKDGSTKVEVCVPLYNIKFGLNPADDELIKHRDFCQFLAHATSVSIERNVEADVEALMSNVRVNKAFTRLFMTFNKAF